MKRDTEKKLGKNRSVPLIGAALSDKEKIAVLRSLRKPPLNKNAEINFVFTKDAKLISEYIKLREIIYAEELGLKGLLGHLDHHDTSGDTHILVVKSGNEVIGGGRITITFPGFNNLLPMENEHFLLKKEVPELLTENTIYAEVSRVIIKPEYRMYKISPNIYSWLNYKAAEFGAGYIFTQSPPLHARSYRIICNRLGIATTIRNDINIPKEKYHGPLKTVLSIMHVNPKVKGVETIKPD